MGGEGSTPKVLLKWRHWTWQTDRQTDIIPISISRVSMAMLTRDKNLTMCLCLSHIPQVAAPCSADFTIANFHKATWYFRSKKLKVDGETSSGSKSRVYHCPHCPYTNSNPKLVHGHKVMHSSPQLKCSYCGHLDHYPSRMMRHMRRRHRGMTAKYFRLPTDGSTSSQQSTTVDDDADGKII